MTQIEIRRVDADHPGDARIPNEPFRLWGRMLPALRDGEWSYTTETFAEAAEMCFPDEPYDPATDDAVFLGAYRGDACVGLAVLRRDMFRYLYLDDLKVRRAFRGQGIGGRLIDACMDEARAMGLIGLYAIGQDDNLSACLFYIRHGFAIGGFDNRAYDGTDQAGKGNIFFYRKLGCISKSASRCTGTP